MPSSRLPSRRFSRRSLDFSPNHSLDFSLDISLHISEMGLTVDRESGDDAIFMFQCIAVCEFKLNLFYDGGCSDLVISKRALDIFISLGRAKLVQEGPIPLRGVGDIKSVCPYGRFQISIPLHNGREASMTGICLDKVTSTFDGFSLSLTAFVKAFVRF